MSDEELALISGLMGEMSEELGDYLSENPDAFNTVMYATDELGLNTINIGLQSSEAAGMMGGINEETIIDETLEMLDDYYAQLSIDVELEKTENIFLGERHYGILSIMEIEGIYYECTQFYLIQGSYTATITFASYEEGGSTTYLDCFYPLS